MFCAGKLEDAEVRPADILASVPHDTSLESQPRAIKVDLCQNLLEILQRATWHEFRALMAQLNCLALFAGRRGAPQTLARSSRFERLESVRIRVPTFFCSLFY